MHVSDMLNKLIIPLLRGIQMKPCWAGFEKKKSEQKHPDWNNAWPLAKHTLHFFTCTVVYFSISNSLIVDVDASK